MSNFQFSTTPKIISAIDSVSQLPQVLTRLGVSKPLIVCDKGIVDAGLYHKIEDVLQSAEFDTLLYDKVCADPSEELVIDAIEFARKQNCDGLIGLGGGSSLDTAKLVAVQTHGKQALGDIYGVDQINYASKTLKLPLVLIPTTAGTGSEVTAVAIVTTGEHTKAGIVSDVLYPDVAILDASLTLGLPAHITAATGIDAMVHAIEAFTSQIKKNPYSDMLAKEALRLLSNNIVRAVEHPKNLDARQAMLLGACLAGQAFANAPVGAIHALAYPLGGHFNIPHGLSNSLVMPHVMRFNLSVASSLYAQLAPIIMNTQASESNTQEHLLATELIEFIEELICRIKLPTSLSALGIKEHDLNILAHDAMKQTRLLVNNPKPLTEADAYAIYSHAL